MTLSLDLQARAWPMREPFAIARGVQTDQPTVIVTLHDAQGLRGRGEGCGVDYAGETPASMIAELDALRGRIEAGVSRGELADLLPPGGARCARSATPKPAGRAHGVALLRLHPPARRRRCGPGSTESASRS